ncbi:hypothetical protein M758_12G146200 [Ceratodon purpureus]|nr:hypothetical protein M758_12G146200 [Ceratodon purpureus]
MSSTMLLCSRTPWPWQPPSAAMKNHHSRSGSDGGEQLEIASGARFPWPSPGQTLPAKAKHMRWECRASWFDFSSESSTKSGGRMTTGDFTILSHLKELGCGELLRKPREVHFSGCINESYAFHCAGGDFFVKINRAFEMDSMFVGESEALKRIEATETVTVPTPLGCGNLPDGGSYIIMKHLRFRPFGMMQVSSQSALGRDLARLHLAEAGNLFGFPMQTRVGIVPLDNRWSSSWCEFFIEQRLRDRFQRVYERLGEDRTDIEEKGAMVLKIANTILKDHNPKPCILHGDLWMGNSGLVATGEVAIFDPACFIGDPEFDLAFEGWKPVPDFPGLSVDFYTAYHQLLPQAPGFEKRHQLYQLFHLLNHFVIYGGEYYTHVMDMMDRILDQ